MNRELHPEWMDLKALKAYCGKSERTLRTWITRADNPLPANRPDGQIMVKKSTFDDWMERQPAKFDSVDVDRVVSEILGEFR